MSINLKRALAVVALSAAAMGLNALPANALPANALPVRAEPASAAPADLAIAFTVADAATPEGFLIVDPNCPPDIICRPRRVQAFLTFVVSTNVSLAGQSLQVQFETVNGTAIAPTDYCAGSGTVTFPPGVFSQAVKVCVVFNSAIEPTENLFLRLKNPNVPADTSDVGEGLIFDGLEVL